MTGGTPSHASSAVGLEGFQGLCEQAPGEEGSLPVSEIVLQVAVGPSARLPRLLAFLTSPALWSQASLL